MESLQFLTCIPTCSICLGECFDCFITCSNSHFLCGKCLEQITPIQNKPCPLCRSAMFNKPIKNLWVEEFSDRLKQQIQESTGKKIGDKVDFFNKNHWDYGKISDIHLMTRSFVIEPHYHLEESILIPIEQHKIHLENLHTKTKNWRNFDYLKNVMSIDILLCRDSYGIGDECGTPDCLHPKVWVKSRIVYLCQKTSFLLGVYIYESNQSPNSVWLDFHSPYLRLVL